MCLQWFVSCISLSSWFTSFCTYHPSHHIVSCSAFHSRLITLLFHKSFVPFFLVPYGLSLQIVDWDWTDLQGISCFSFSFFYTRYVLLLDTHVHMLDCKLFTSLPNLYIVYSTSSHLFQDLCTLPCLRKRQHYYQLTVVKCTQYKTNSFYRYLLKFRWLHACYDDMLMWQWLLLALTEYVTITFCICFNCCHFLLCFRR